MTGPNYRFADGCGNCAHVAWVWANLTFHCTLLAAQPVKTGDKEKWDNAFSDRWNEWADATFVRTDHICDSWKQEREEHHGEAQGA